MTSATGPGVLIRDVRGDGLAWREVGQGPPMVLLHGLGGSRISWEPQMQGLADRFRLVAWDLPGYGDSAALPGPLTFDALADAVVELLDHLGEDRVHLVGISFGGMIAQYVAVRAADRLASLSLMATSACFGLDGTDPAQWRSERLAPLEAGRQPADFAPDVLRGIAGPHLDQAALVDQCAAMARIPAPALARSIDCLVTHDARTVLAAVTVPTQVLVGEHDTETPVAYAADLAQRITGAVLHVVPGAGHLLNAEAPQLVNDLLAAHAEGVPR